jgi:hypothetical protein
MAGRPKGLPKTGGRVKGTPNKNNPIKVYLAAHSLKYFEPYEREDGTVVSDFEMDLINLRADERVSAEIRLLRYHTPEMKSIDGDITVTDAQKSIEDKLSELCGEDG